LDCHSECASVNRCRKLRGGELPVVIAAHRQVGNCATLVRLNRFHARSVIIVGAVVYDSASPKTLATLPAGSDIRGGNLDRHNRLPARFPTDNCWSSVVRISSPFAALLGYSPAARV
jgi:hypothetical protein